MPIRNPHDLDDRLLRVIHQPFGTTTLGAELIGRIDGLGGAGSVVRIGVAYARATGVLRLAPAFRRLRNRGGRVEVVVGVGRDTVTTYQALQVLRDFADSVWVFNNRATTFHPKVYLLEDGENSAVAYVGSNNLTPGGLYTNYEASVEFDLNLTDPDDRRVFDSLKAVVETARAAVGQGVEVDSNAVVQRLVMAGYVEDETSPLRRRTRAQDAQAEGHDEDEPEELFGASSPPPPAPAIDEDLRNLIPIPRRTQATASPYSQVAEPVVEQSYGEVSSGDVRAAEAFVMELDNRDTRQLAGYSPEIYIPIAARDANPAFWGWPEDYHPSPQAGHPEKRVSVLVRAANGDQLLARNKRLWFYDARSEFRFNNRELIAGSAAGDLLVVYRNGGEFGGEAYEYEAVVIPAHDALYPGFQAACVNTASGIKSWGYV